jgi:hypothetical protein
MCYAIDVVQNIADPGFTSDAVSVLIDRVAQTSSAQESCVYRSLSAHGFAAVDTVGVFASFVRRRPSFSLIDGLCL